MRVGYLVDTDWAVQHLRGDAGIVGGLEELKPEGLGLSVISLAELYEGVFSSRDPRASEEGLNNFLRRVVLIGIDEEICRLFGRARGRLRAGGKVVGGFDLLIGSTALRHDVTVLTNNRRHFEVIEGVRLEST